MSAFAFLLTLGCCIAVFALPRRRAVIPLLICTCFLTAAQRVDVLGLNLNTLRIVIITGIARTLLQGDYRILVTNRTDALVALFGIWFLVSSYVHNGEENPLIFNCGRVLNFVGVYYLFRCFITSAAEVYELLPVLALILLCIASTMTYEQFSGHNPFSIFGGVPSEVKLRSGRLRSQGPFLHPILAGSIGAASFPLFFSLWRSRQTFFFIGVSASIVMVLTSASSGPVMSFLLAGAALLLWHRRGVLSPLLFSIPFIYILLELTMSRPAYYVIAMIDLTGGSTGWHRAKLISAAIEHFNEWAIGGTAYTRHWMPTGVSWSPDHTDITNYYILLGVHAGIAASLVFLAIVITTFSNLTYYIRSVSSVDPASSFLAYTVGCCHFSHITTNVSVAYFDQSYIFMVLPIAISASFFSEVSGSQLES